MGVALHRAPHVPILQDWTLAGDSRAVRKRQCSMCRLYAQMLDDLAHFGL